MTARRPVLLAPFVLLLVALAGCSGQGGSSASSTSGSGRSDAAAAAPAAAEAQKGGAAAVPAGLALGRDVVRTASLTLEVADLRATAARVRGAAESAGGVLESEDATDGADVLRLRVAPERLAGTVDALSRLGRETARTVGSQDVSQQVADVDSRLATQRASVARVRALLDRAQNLTDVAALEAQLTQREADLESLQARTNALHDQVDLATVTVTLTRTGAAASATGFRDGLAGGWHAFLTGARGAAVVVGAVLPFLPLVALALWAVRWFRRRPAAA